MVRFRLALVLTAAAAGLSAPALAAPAPANVDFALYGGDTNGARYSPLTQIDKSNVGRLQQAWRFDMDPGGLQTQPIVIGGVLYAATTRANVVALDAATGKLKWTFEPVAAGGQPRGVTWWSDGKERRLFVVLVNWLYALDADTGRPIPSFGQNGRIDLRENLRGRAQDNFVTSGTPGVIYKDMYIIGSRVSETEPASPGDIRAFDVRTGQVRWAFHTIPAAGEPGAETWPAGAREKLGGANNWAGLVVDQKRGVAYVPTGSAADDFYSANRPGANRFANSVIALDANTGRRLWDFQAIQHDILDADFGTPPTLLTVNRNGKRVDAVVATNKIGFIYLLDRDTGEPLLPIERVKVPTSPAPPGVQPFPTQLKPLLPAPLSRITITADTLTDRTLEANAWARAEFRKFNSGEFFAPLVVGKETAVSPGSGGGGEWGGGALDPRTGVYYINANNVAYSWSLSERAQAAGGQAPGGQGGPGAQPGQEIGGLGQRSRYVFNGYRRWDDPEGYPASATPWGTLNAVDMNTGAYLWRVPFGEYPELTAKGFKDHGTESYGGPVVTASGLLFIGATIYDRKLRAYDSQTGKVLWETLLPFAGTATPAVYQAGGRQFVVIAASGARDRQGPRGAAYVAYALPPQ
ncbi:MAG: PQQ-binding-like beta-propeller repeat protein [Caulobacteraceae bacterium]